VWDLGWHGIDGRARREPTPRKLFIERQRGYAIASLAGQLRAVGKQLRGWLRACSAPSARAAIVVKLLQEPWTLVFLFSTSKILRRCGRIHFRMCVAGQQGRLPRRCTVRTGDSRTAAASVRHSMIEDPIPRSRRSSFGPGRRCVCRWNSHHSARRLGSCENLLLDRGGSFTLADCAGAPSPRGRSSGEASSRVRGESVGRQGEKLARAVGASASCSAPPAESRRGNFAEYVVGSSSDARRVMKQSFSCAAFRRRSKRPPQTWRPKLSGAARSPARMRVSQPSIAR